MAVESTARKKPAEATPLFRSAPHNIEVEQALLGAILVNNEAFYRVSDFLKPEHFFEPLHQKVFKDIAALVRVTRVRPGGPARAQAQATAETAAVRATGPRATAQQRAWWTSAHPPRQVRLR